MPEAKTIAVQNIKGGVGKTTLAVNLAARLVERHQKKVLVVDADGQCNASFYLIDDQAFVDRTGAGDRDVGNIYDLFHREVKYIDIVTGETHGPRGVAKGHTAKVRDGSSGGELHLLCGSPKLFEVQEVAPEICAVRVGKWVRQIVNKFDFIVFDCAPSVSSVSLSVLRASSSIVVPMKPDLFSLQGLPILFNALESYRDVLGIKAKVRAVVPTMFPPASKKATRSRADAYLTQIAQVCARLDTKLLPAKISESAEYPKSYDSRSPIGFSTKSSHTGLVGELDAVLSALEVV